MLNCSQGLVLATTAMVVSTTVAVLAYSRQKSYPEQESSSSSRDQSLRSCLCSSDEVERQKKKKKMKRVRFAEDVKEPVRRISMEEDGLELQSQIKRGRSDCCSSRRRSSDGSCRDELMPPNRAALYSCILRDRVNRIACSY